MKNHNIKVILILILEKINILFPDELYLKLQFRLRMGYKLDLDNPKTFSEKLQWLKLNNKNKQYTSLVDKYEVKSYIEKVIGRSYVIPTLGVWDTPEQIQWSSLPNQFVLKTTHGGGSSGVVICKNKEQINIEAIKHSLNKSLKQDIYKIFREWPYKDVNRRILAEQYLEQEDGSDLIEYKFFCFHGSPEFLYVRHTDRETKKKSLCFVTRNWEMTSFRRKKDGPVTVIPPKPKLYTEMLMVAQKLSSEFPFVRVDLYSNNNQVYFSELTFYPSSGLLPFDSYESDRKIGDMIDLPKILCYDRE